MKRNHYLRLIFAVFLAALPLPGKATVFFNDTFSGGSTLNSATPADPTSASTAYELIANKSWNPTPSVTANDLKFGIAATTSGYIQAQALFSTNPVALVQPGDFIQLTVVFTNTTGLLTAAGQLGFGLYNSGQVKPVAGGINNGSPASFTGYAQNWLGYCADINFTGAASRIMTRPAQSGSTIANQDLFSFGTSSSYASGSTISSTTANATLTAGSTYTEVLTITLNDVNSLAITNVLYAGPNASGTVVTNFGAIATNTTFLTSGFDALTIGYCGRANTGGAPLIDVSSIKVEGSITAITTPPTITSEPVPVTVAANGSCIFNVAATGINVTYQWRRYGTNLLNSGNIAGATSSSLIINYAGVADAASGANGYYCVVTGAGNFSTNSFTNSLTLVTAKNLIWNGNGTDWDLNTSANWNDPVNPTTFNYGDSVTFNDVGAVNPLVTLNGSFLSASKWLVAGSTAYAFGGAGSFAGTGSLIFNSSAGGNIQLNVANTHTGGTIVSNDNSALNLYVQKYQVLGNGPLTLAKPGSVEFTVTGSATLGIPGDVIVNDDFTFQFDGSGAFAGVILGNLSGSVGKTLTFNQLDLSTTNRYRVYGTNTVCDANIVLNGAAASQAIYNGTVLAPYGANGIQSYNGVISGNGGIVQRGGVTTILSGANTYSGGTYPTTGTIALGSDTVGNVTSGPIGIGPLFVVPEVPNTTGSGTVLAWGGARTIANPIQYPSATNNQTLIIGGTNNLTFTGPVTLNGNDGQGTQTNRIFQVNNTGLTTISGVISDGGAGFGLTKSGTGVLALSNTETYTGPTTVSGGTLLVNGQIGSGAVTVTNGAIGGSGTIGGAVTVQNAGSVVPGNQGIGTLTLSSSLTLLGGTTNYIEVNKQAGTRDRVIANSIAYNGTLSATNLAGSLNVGDTFTIFNATTSSGNFTNIIGSPGAGLAWSFNPTNGVLSVIAGMATNPTNITFSVSGSTMTLTWPADHLGWTLQSNAVSLTSTSSWFTVPGSTTATNMSINVDSSKTNVFYRLKL